MRRVISKRNGVIFFAIAAGGMLAIPAFDDAQSLEHQSCSRITRSNTAYCCPNVSPYRGGNRLRPGYAEFCAYGYASWEGARFRGREFFTPDRPGNLSPFGNPGPFGGSPPPGNPGGPFGSGGPPGVTPSAPPGVAIVFPPGGPSGPGSPGGPGNPGAPGNPSGPPGTGTPPGFTPPAGGTPPGGPPVVINPPPVNPPGPPVALNANPAGHFVPGHGVGILAPNSPTIPGPAGPGGAGNPGLGGFGPPGQFGKR